MRNVISRILNKLLRFKERNPDTVKGDHELAYWKDRKAEEGTLSNSHYEYFYTTHFGFEKSFFTEKKILDIGCGPRGSLEWADMVTKRIGLDPIAHSYISLGINKHKMQYVAAQSEYIPFQDEYFDVVCSFNSLDHVGDLDLTIKEILRVISRGGLFLLLTELNHNPTDCEPITYTWDIIDKFSPPLKAVEQGHYESFPDGMYASIQKGVPYNHNSQEKRIGILSAKFKKPL